MKIGKNKIYIFLSILLIFALLVTSNTNMDVLVAKKLTMNKVDIKYTDRFNKLRINNKEVFCLEFNRSAISGKTYSTGAYSKQGLNSAQWETLNRIANIGYNSKRSSDAWYIATQMVIWKNLAKWNIKGSQKGGFSKLHNHIKSVVPKYNDKVKTIESELKTMNKILTSKVSFNNTTLKSEKGKTLTKTYTDKNKILQYLKVASTPKGVSAKIKGNTLTVEFSKNAINGNINLEPKLNISMMKNKTYFYSSSSQNVAQLGGITAKAYGAISIKLHDKPKDGYGNFSFDKIIKFSKDAGFSVIPDGTGFSKLEFTLYAQEDIKNVEGLIKFKKDSQVAKSNPDGHGKVFFRNILPGKYYIKETKSLAGLIKKSKTYPVTLTKNGSSVTTKLWSNEATINNDITKVEISKKDITGQNEIPGAKMELLDESGKTVVSWTSTNKPYLIEGLYTGKSYILIERLAPRGYVKTASKFKFVVKNNRDIQKHHIKNKQMFFIKTDKYGKILYGGKYIVIDKDGKTITKFNGIFKDAGKLIGSSKKQGIPISNLIEGSEYTLREIEPPKGYGIAEDMKFMVNKGEENDVIIMIDEKVNIRTTAIDSDTDDHISNPDKDITINDYVYYEALIPGKSYEIIGKLMNKSTKKPLLDDNGKEITNTVNFAAGSNGKGKIKVEFKIKGKTLAGKTTVAFETLKKDGKKLAIHADINNENQSVKFPSLKTKANISKDNKVVKDKISYDNLLPNKKYKIKGWIVDKNTGKRIKGTESIHEFTPKKDKGNLMMKINSSNIKAGEYVVFEECYLNGKLVSEHKDIKDKHQTVIKKKGILKESSKLKTGENFPLYASIFILITSMIGVIIMIRNRKKRI